MSEGACFPYPTRVSRATRFLVILAAATSLLMGLALDENGQAQEGSSSGAYWLGESFRGLPLTATPGSGYIYGACRAPTLDAHRRSRCRTPRPAPATPSASMSPPPGSTCSAGVA